MASRLLICTAWQVLEAVGNAKTRRNNNSSRFGKYINLLFDIDTNIVGAEMRTFLLEKSRVTNTDASNERSYHVLYQLLASAPLQGKVPEDFRYLSLSGCTTVPNVDDAVDFKQLQVCGRSLGGQSWSGRSLGGQS